jgi:hypothetical protein
MVKQLRFQLPIQDIPQVVDALLIGLPDGWVEISANERGRTAIEAVFPDAYIAWRDPGKGFPEEWLGFTLNLPDVASRTKHHLPPINNTPLDDARPDALAFLLAIAAKNQGVRSGIWRENRKIEIFHPPSV